MAVPVPSVPRVRLEPEDKTWGMYEFSLSDPDETLVRVGWPTNLRSNG